MTTRKPAWKLLPIIVALMGALLAAVERLALPPAMRTILQVAVTAGGFSMIGLWIRCNRIAIALEEWNEENRRSALDQERAGELIEAPCAGGNRGAMTGARTPDLAHGRPPRSLRSEVVRWGAARSGE